MNKRTLLLIFATALAVRTAFAFVGHPWLVGHGYPQWGWEWNDGYDPLARNVLAGRGFSLDGLQPTARRMPLYPLLLAGLMKTFGMGGYVTATLLLQSVISSLTAVFCLIIGTRLFGRRAGVIAGLIYSFHFSAVIYVARCLTEALFFFLLAAASLLFLKAIDRPGLTAALLSGTCFGLSYLTRPTAIALLPGTALVLYLGTKERRPAGKALAVFLISLAFLVPWSLRNYRLSGFPVALTTYGGGTWFQGYYFSDRFFKVTGPRLQLDLDALKTKDDIILRRWPEVGTASGIRREVLEDRAAYRLVFETLRERPLRSAFVFVRGLGLAVFANYSQSMTILGFVLSLLLVPPAFWTGIRVFRQRRASGPVLFLICVVGYMDLLHAVIYPHIRFFSCALFALVPLAAYFYSEKLLGRREARREFRPGR